MEDIDIEILNVHEDYEEKEFDIIPVQDEKTKVYSIKNYEVEATKDAAVSNIQAMPIPQVVINNLDSRIWGIWRGVKTVNVK